MRIKTSHSNYTIPEELNSDEYIKKYINTKEQLENIIKYICTKFQNFISIKNHSLLGEVLILE